MLTDAVHGGRLRRLRRGLRGRRAPPGPQDWSGTDGFGFWFYGANSGLLYQAEILDNRSNPSADTAERFDYDFADNFSGWRYVRIPFSAFERATDFQPPGAPNDGLTLTEMWGWAMVLPVSAAARTFAIDDVGPIDHVIDDFQSWPARGHGRRAASPSASSRSRAPSSTVAIATTATPPAPDPARGGRAERRPPGRLRRDLLRRRRRTTSTTAALTAWVPQDWSRYEGFALWLYGTGSGTDLFVDLIENRNPGSTRDDAERWTAGFPDDFTGWKQLRFPFASLARKEIGNGAPNDGLGSDRGPRLGLRRPGHGRSAPLLPRPGDAVRRGGRAAADRGLRRRRASASTKAARAPWPCA